MYYYYFFFFNAFQAEHSNPFILVNEIFNIGESQLYLRGLTLLFTEEMNCNILNDSGVCVGTIKLKMALYPFDYQPTPNEVYKFKYLD